MKWKLTQKKIKFINPLTHATLNPNRTIYFFPNVDCIFINYIGHHLFSIGFHLFFFCLCFSFNFQSEHLEQQVKEMSSAIETYKIENLKLDADLKAAIDKIYDLREIIGELETQINSKNSKQNVLLNKLKALEVYMNDQTTANESLQHEVESLKMEITPAYEETIKNLEEQLKNFETTAEQNVIIERIACNLRDIEDNLDRKTQVLESIYVSTGSVTACSSPSEDVSIKGSLSNLDGTVISPRNFKVCLSIVFFCVQFFIA